MPRRDAHWATTLFSVVAMVVGLLFVGSAQAEPQPTLADVEKAFHDVEAANEALNAINENIKAADAEIADLQADVDAVQGTYAIQRDELAAVIVQQHMDAPLGPTVNLMGSKDPQAFLDGLGAVQAFNTSRADALEAFADLADTYEARQRRLEARKAQLNADQANATKKKAEIQKAYEAAKDKLDMLSLSDQQRFASGMTSISRDLLRSLPPPNGAVATAVVNFAYAQLGDPYVYGGSGPDAWDCSGLTQAAYASAGISIPRVVGPQYSASTKVPFSQIQPGDLVFYADMSHVAIYIGGGKVIHAPYPGRVVSIDGMYHYSLAGRFG